MTERLPRNEAESLYRAIAERAGARRRRRPIAQGMLALIMLGAGAGVAWGVFSAFHVGREPLGPVRSHPVPGPNPRFGSLTPLGPSEQLSSVAASGPADVWAVGSRSTKKNLTSLSLVEHWDGKEWGIVPCPDVGGLRGVTAPAPGEMWAVGTKGLLHWNADHCVRLSLPKVGHGLSLSAIAALGPADVWVVGQQTGQLYAKNTVGLNTLVAHWTGSRWRVLPTPNRSRRDNYLNGVVAISPTNVWVAGYSQTVSGIPLTLIMHWNGTSWRIVPSPDPGDSYNVVWGMGRDGSGGVWAVGHYGNDHGYTTALFLRWDGRSWGIVQPPSDPLFSVTGLNGSSDQDVWAVGSEPTSSFAIAHFDGTRWTNVDMTGPTKPYGSSLFDVIMASRSDGWAVGERSTKSGHGAAALIEHWDGTSWRVVSPG